MDRNLIRISKKMSFVLRHHPERIGIKLDAYGRVNLAKFIQKFNQHYQMHLDETIINQVNTNSDKLRFAIEGTTIWALYGHSVPVKPLNAPTMPPKYLFHGTTHVAAKLIEVAGIQKMDRDFVHLSANPQMAVQVGKRRDNQPVIFRVAAQQASEAGLQFYATKSGIWLVDHVPPKYLQRVTESNIL